MGYGIRDVAVPIVGVGRDGDAWGVDMCWVAHV